MQPFEKVILHFDGDSFFASVEQVMDYRLKGKPVVTGGERGAITSASYEAKRLGISRGVTLRDAKKICPDLAIVPGNYLWYSVFAERMYTIVREFTSIVEEYSIDECFADITGLDVVMKMSYEDIARVIKSKLETSLGVTFGVGMGPSKVLAKVASKHRKPAGFTVITSQNREDFLRELPLGKVWGIGPASSIAFSKMGVFTALQLAETTDAWIDHHRVSLPYREIRAELQGMSVKELSLEYEIPHSIIVSRTFRPPSSDREVLISQLSKHIESACAKARRYGVCAREMRFYLKTQEFAYKGYECSLPLPTASPIDIIRMVKKFINRIYVPGVLYRATGICLRGFVPESHLSSDLFGESVGVEKRSHVHKVIDMLSRKFGDHTVFLGSSMKALGDQKIRERGKTLEIPMLGICRTTNIGVVRCVE